ncbi:MAG: c-type cytochrome [Bryobacterales bacterium]|nr:c-type cytochrome [Bryobacterales bacterium]
MNLWLRPMAALVFFATLLPAQSKVERGRYLAEEAARCQECHTPRLPGGGFDRSKWMKGAVLDIKPLEPIENWKKTAPDLTRSSRLWLKWGDLALLNYLKTGKGPGGKVSARPMPAYTFKHEDADAIVEYLRSLP